MLSSTTCICIMYKSKGLKTSLDKSEILCFYWFIPDMNLTCSVLKGWTTYESLLLSSSCFLHFLFRAFLKRSWCATFIMTRCVSEEWRGYFISLHFSELQEKCWPEIKVFWSGDEILHVSECGWTTFYQQVCKTRTRMCLSFSVSDWN